MSGISLLEPEGPWTVYLCVVVFVLVVVCVVMATMDSSNEDSKRKAQACGSWTSPITAEMITADFVKMPEGDLKVSSDGKQLYWVEDRPSEGGRSVVVKHILTSCLAGKQEDEIPENFSARTRVHEYGGAAYYPFEGGVIFSNLEDQRLYMTIPDNEIGGKEVMALTAEGPYRYADGMVDVSRARQSHLGSWVNAEFYCVREDHTEDTPSTVVNDIIALNLTTREVRVVASGNDFYAAPRVSPDGKWIAYLTWNHPNMPWDGCKLMVSRLNDATGLVEYSFVVAGGPRTSISQPIWRHLPGDKASLQLLYSSDAGEWYNPYMISAEHFPTTGGDGEATLELCAVRVLDVEADCGCPHWRFGGMRVGVRGSDQAAVVSCRLHGRSRVFVVPVGREGTVADPLPLSDRAPQSVTAVCCDPRTSAVYLLGGSPESPLGVYALTEESGGGALPYACSLLRSSASGEHSDLDGFVSTPQPIHFKTVPMGQHDLCHAWYYPPTNRDHRPLPDELPPLLVKAHGGPTGAASTVFRLDIQYWTSRGIGVLDVNYRGSYGYGRTYRQALSEEHAWGIMDVDDVCQGALYLANASKVDRERICIDGGSAGGYTTLAALTKRDVFKAGCSMYGIGDITLLARDTHKFESRYPDYLIGPWPEAQELYEERSPVNHIGGLSCPVLLLQGADDKVVPPNQAEEMFDALKAKGIPCAYVLFPGEGHGFRRAEHIQMALHAELYFYSQVFNFPYPAADVKPELDIVGL